MKKEEVLPVSVIATLLVLGSFVMLICMLCFLFNFQLGDGIWFTVGGQHIPFAASPQVSVHVVFTVFHNFISSKILLFHLLSVFTHNFIFRIYGLSSAVLVGSIKSRYTLLFFLSVIFLFPFFL